MNDWRQLLIEIRGAIPNGTWKIVGSACDIDPERVRRIGSGRRKRDLLHSEGERVLALHSVLLKDRDI